MGRLDGKGCEGEVHPSVSGMELGTVQHCTNLTPECV